MLLNNKDFALLTTKLGTPIVASDIINGHEKLSDDVRYGLHQDISEKQPDTALLAIAVSARFVANKYISQCTNLKILSMECDRIINEYGDLWLKNLKNQTISEDQMFDILIHTAEDLEGLAELLEYNYHSLKDVNYEAAELCDILQVQAKAHGLIAQSFIDAADALIEKQTQETISIKRYEDNVISFPNANT